MTDREDLRAGEVPSDLSAAMEYNDVTLSAPITDVLATIDGQNDEAPWHWLVILESGVFAYITGSCDYTGWDCQSSCEAYEAPNIRDCARLIPEAERGDLLAQLPSGLRDEALS